MIYNTVYELVNLKGVGAVTKFMKCDDEYYFYLYCKGMDLRLEDDAEFNKKYFCEEAVHYYVVKVYGDGEWIAYLDGINNRREVRKNKAIEKLINAALSLKLDNQIYNEDRDSNLPRLFEQCEKGENTISDDGMPF